jgi:hypothetical protein
MPRDRAPSRKMSEASEDAAAAVAVPKRKRKRKKKSTPPPTNVLDAKANIIEADESNLPPPAKKSHKQKKQEISPVVVLPDLGSEIIHKNNTSASASSSFSSSATSSSATKKNTACSGNRAITKASAPSLQVLRMKTPGVPRMDNTSVARPIVYGSMAFWLGKQANEFHSHRWTIYIRGLECEDLSYMISKVIFSLHPDFAEPERTFLFCMFSSVTIGV